MTGTQTPPQRPQPGFVERVIDDAGSRARLRPDDIDVSAPGFSQFLYETALPIVGGNAVLWGLYKVGQAGDVFDRWLLWVALILGTVALGAVISRRVGDISLGVLAASIMVTSSGLLGSVPAGAIIALVAILVAALVANQRASASSAVIVAVYLPVAAVAGIGDSGNAAIARIAIEAFGLSTLFVACSWRQHRAAARAIIVVATLLALYETSKDSVDVLTGVALIAWFALLAIVQELRTRGERVSQARQFAGAGMAVVLIWAGVALALSGAVAAWTAFILVLVMQIAISRGDLDSLTTRMGWPSLALIAAIWQTESFGLTTKLAATPGIALALYLLALWRNKRFPSDLATAIALAMGAYSVYAADGAPSAAVFATGILSALTIVLLADRPPLEASLPWWTGFVTRSQLDVVAKIAQIALRPIWSTTLGGMIASYAKTGYKWLTSLLGAEGVRSATLLRLAGHACGAAVLARQGYRVADAIFDDPSLARVMASAAWLLWGAQLVGSGARRQSAALQLTGLAFLLVPVVTWGDVLAGARATTADFAIVVMATGVALWLVSYRMRRSAAQIKIP